MTGVALIIVGLFVILQTTRGPLAQVIGFKS